MNDTVDSRLRALFDEAGVETVLWNLAAWVHDKSSSTPYGRRLESDLRIALFNYQNREEHFGQKVSER